MALSEISISIIGSGNVAWHVARRLFACGYSISCVFSRNISNAALLAEQVNAKATHTLTSIPTSDLYIFAIKDDAYQEIISNFPQTQAICVHTSGSLEMDILGKLSDNYGVLYPFQSFSKDKLIAFEKVPLCVEASNEQTESFLMKIAGVISPIIYLLSTEQRAYLHLAGVFASNFSNALYVIAQQILQQRNMDFKMILPLINETAEKVNNLSPTEAQTGPAVRNDARIMSKHIEMIKSTDWSEIYQLISKIIQKQQAI
ncbi:MAG: DUF2520 domain-containing protein [Bacteroidales bacterium]|jgi:predicted short-subunit dehydrogenase-like oxidoreductase (DUF2520 family)|nr:DUF2520 domain-containing protein [Bacteroidales bacterium]